MAKFVADKEFWDIFPDAAIGILSLDNVQESKKLSDSEAAEVEGFLKEAITESKKLP